MPLFSRQRGKFRRVSLEKVQPPQMPGVAGGMHVTGLTPAVLLGVLFAAALVLAVVGGQPPMRFSLGDAVTSDVRARVPFTYEDTEATRQARIQARVETPGVYDFDASAVRAARSRLAALFDELAASATTRERLAAVRAELPVADPGEFERLRSDLRPGGPNVVRPVALGLLDDLASTSILTAAGKAQVGSVAVTVRGGPAGPSASCALKDVLDLPAARAMVDAAVKNAAFVPFPQTGAALGTWIRRYVTPTLHYNDVETQSARRAAEEAVETQHVVKRANDLLIVAPNRIGLAEYDMLAAEQSAFLRTQRPSERWKRIAGVSVIIVVAFAIGGLLLLHYRPRVLASKVRLTVLGLLLVLMVVVARGLLYIRWIPYPLYLVPVAFASMILALAYDRVFACAMTLFIALMVGLATEADLRPLLVLVSGGLVASLYTTNIRKRTKLLKLGLVVGLVHVVVIAGVGLGQFHGVRALAEQAAVGMINGILVGFAITGLLPFFEKLFRITTDISLLELGDLNQPVLKSFVLRAPGSYNHSLAVGVLAESAARAVGADDLLARVGSYFHDIGKINKPHYFVENQGDGGSRHDRLSPQMSALIIIAHAKDGLELGRDLGLPRSILDIIAQHHGTTLVEYFYKRAREQADDDEVTDEYIYRYPGPTPRTREAAIVMLADSVESASRVLSDPTPARVRTLVHNIIETKLHDGQLEECNLTLRELHGIEDSLAKGLISVFHGRIRY